MTRKALTTALGKERDQLVTQIFKRFAELERLLLRAMDEHDAGNLPEARILLNEALDIECDVTGDTVILSDLAEAWEVDYERDQRDPLPPAKPTKCPSCQNDMALADWVHETVIDGHTVNHELAHVLRCSACGEALLTSQELEAYELHAAREVLMAGFPVSGQAMRYARKALGFRRPELATLFGMSIHQIELMESAPQVDRSLCLAMVALLDQRK